jgi:superfamily II DNA or RNA helicase
MSILRPYQLQALAAFRETLGPDVNRVAIEMATGLGKTVTGAQAAVEWWLNSFQDAGRRVLVLVPTDEICQQWVTKLKLAVQRSGQPMTIGVVKAERNEPSADIVVGSVATLAQPGRREQITDVGFVIVDEAHHAVTPSCLAILEHYGALPSCDHQYTDMGHCFDCRDTGWLAPPVPALGLSATLARSDGQGLGKVWQDMPFSRSLTWAIRRGYLIDLVPYTIKIPELDTSSDGALDTSLADGIAPEAVVQAWLDRAHDGPDMDPAQTSGRFHPSTVLFAPLVKSAQAFADAFNSAGVKAEVVHGKMADAEVAAVMARYEAGVTTVVCNAMKLTEGWDSPRTMCVIVARPTQSVPLFVQMVGRGLRPWIGPEAPPREDQRCILLCVQGGTQQLATPADLSENVGDTRDGESFLEMEDRWDLGKDIPTEDTSYRGPVRVERWDPLVQASSKAWKYTAGGVPFLPTAKRSDGYVFLVERGGQWDVWYRGLTGARTRPEGYRVSKLATAPDIELAMAVAEDEAQERGGDIGALLADKGRAWRKGKPTEKALAEARRELDPAVIERIMTSKAGGKAGKLSDQIDIVKATRILDRVVGKIKERGSKA